MQNRKAEPKASENGRHPPRGLAPPVLGGGVYAREVGVKVRCQQLRLVREVGVKVRCQQL
jgi:hypothetical protein